MGDTGTTYQGALIIEPPLNPREVRALAAFFDSRRIQTEGGPLDCRTLPGFHPDIIDMNRPPKGQPGLWCDLRVSEDGKTLEWDGTRHTTPPDLDKWIAYVIDHLLKPDAEFDIRERNFDLSQMSDEDLLHYFTFDHYVNGILEAEGDGDTWKVYVIDNEVSVVRPFSPLPIAVPAEDDDDDEG
jgi:hypothetical protein